jgi:pimeloyl-ACP methyl ester carboxylesterase
MTGGELTGSRVEVRSPVGPPLLFVHGLFGGAWVFEGWQRYAAERGYSSLAINLRGHHGSRPVADIGRVSVAAYVEDGLEAARRLGRPVVVGHSLGGFVAQKLAEADAVCAAVLLCAAPPRGIPVMGPWLLVRQIRYLPAVLGSRPLRPARADADRLILNRVPPGEREGLFAKLVPDSGRAARELLLGRFAVDERRVRCPVLSVSAGDDRFVVPRVGRALARKYGAEYRRFEGHGHAIVAEPGWERVAEAVLEWVGRKSAQRQG